MPNRKDYDVVVKVCDFTTKSKNTGKVIDKESVLTNVVNNDNFKSRLAAGKILGLFTHKGRYDPQSNKIPHEDSVALSPYLSNYTKDIWVEGDDLLAGINIIKDAEFGKRLSSLLKSGIKIPVSMSVNAKATRDKYFINDLMGIDFTFAPDLDSKVLQVNFSCNNSESPDEGTYEFSYSGRIESINESFSEDFFIVKNDNPEEFEAWSGTQWSKTIQPMLFETKDHAEEYIKAHDFKEGKVSNFSDTAFDKYSLKDALSSKDNPSYDAVMKALNGRDLNDLSEEEIKKIAMDVGLLFSENNNLEFSEVNFSLQTYMQELRLAPHQILKKRIYEVITIVNQRKQDWIDKNEEVLKGYIDIYVLQWVQGLLNSPNSQFNLIMGLQLNRYVKDRSKLLSLQRSLNKVRQQLNRTGIINNTLQKEVNKNFQEVMTGIFEFINSKTYTTGKRLK